MPGAQELLAAAFGTVPPLVSELVGDARLEDLEAFAANVVVPFDGAPVRIAASDRRDPERWERAVRRRFGCPELDAFLGLVGPGTRRMIDTDGADSAELYLDDLGPEQSLANAPDGSLLAATLHVPSLVRTFLVWQEQPPTALLEPSLRARCTRLLELGALGRWAVRVRDGAAVSFLWVSESRYRRDGSKTRAIVEALSPPRAWSAVAECAERLGWQPYPDAIEGRFAGFDVTVGITRAARKR
jgi:hypothetical protein